jgi:nucleoside-diphosphate-sugar epimerase
VTWNQIYSIIADELGVELNACYVPSELLNKIGPYDFEGTLLGDKAHTVIFDNSKIKRAVPGFTASVRADQGIRNTVRYILAHKECQTDDEDFDRWCDKVADAMNNIKI